MYMMFIDGEVKPGKKDEFVKAWSTQILPLLKKQDGFVDEILLWQEGSPNNGCGLSFWRTKDQAERYRRDVFPQAKNFVEPLLHGAPKVRGYEVEVAETFSIAARKAA